jgi:cytoskeletal protein CcmA (bactofilin family)
MAQSRTSRSNSGGGGGTIGRGARVVGRVTGDGDLAIYGELEGDIVLRGALTIGEGATLTSNVDADSVVVSGTIAGDINARGTVHITGGSNVRGNIRGEEIAIDDGAEFAGRLDCEFDLPSELSGNAPRARHR